MDISRAQGKTNVNGTPGMSNGGYEGLCFCMGIWLSWRLAYMGSCDGCGIGCGWMDVDLGGVI